MASTFSSLKIELIGTGEQDGTWSTTTNTNLGTTIEQAITGSGNVTFTGSDVTLTLVNSNASQTARNLRLVCVGVANGPRQLIVPSIEKQYIVKNELTSTVTIRTASGAGVLIPAGKSITVFNDGTNVVEVNTYAANLTANTLTYGGVTLPSSVSGTGSMVLANSPAFTGTPTAPTAAPGTNTTQIATTAFVQEVAGNLGTMSSQNANTVAITGGTIEGITDLAVADGGTGASSLNGVVVGTGTAALTAIAPGAAGSMLRSNGTAWALASIAALQPTVVFDGTLAYNTTRTLTIDNTKLTVWFLNTGGGEGGRGPLAVGYAWGTSSLGGVVYFINAFVDFQVFGGGSVLKSVPPGSGTQLLIQPVNNRPGSYGSQSQAQCLVLQF